MKNKLITLTFCILAATNALKAQDEPYIPLLDTGKLWVEAMRMEFGDIMITEKWIGNTVIYNDTVYYEFFGDDLGSEPRYLREDTIGRKVFNSGYYYDDLEEGLLYDFSLEVGDSIDCINWSCKLYLDSIQYLNFSNNKHRIFYFHSNWGSDTGFDPIWIEGIGSMAGILQVDNSINLIGMGQTELNCYYENDSLLFQSQMAILYGCHFEYLNIKEIKAKNSKLYPNPVSGISTLTFYNLKNETVKLNILNLFGEVIYSYQTTEDKIEINSKKLYPGIFIYTLSKNNQLFYSNKLIIQ